ncbi:FMN-binding negative transcriptional regulator [Nonomuraea sp. SYSU D8015]|uniref:FMN-binding negative transcriptional regulator n=1 Tax=Nonomuraea sp. SYSU D8015 TaxID=2593644 RepID=UPI00166065DE|nr:FMN-binding negative transcriptional regulator [Nonomuraea sp. SYSU D8015]
MWNPPAFRPDSPARIDRLIRENPFAILTSTVGDAPMATHALVIPRPGPDGAPLDVLYGHMARTNAHWRGLLESPSVLVIFTGPHGYVSPVTYGVTPAAPTWNYATVHVSGRLRILDDPAAMLEAIEATVAALDPGWDMGPSMDYARRILPGLVAFEIDVTDVRATFKLSQDKPAEVRQLVIDAFAASGRGSEAELAALMTDVNSPRW